LLLSGTWAEEQLTQAKALGCSVLHKPFMIEELMTWLEECEKRRDPTRTLVDSFPGCAHPSIAEDG